MNKNGLSLKDGERKGVWAGNFKLALRAGDMGVHKSAPRLIRRQGYLRLLGLVICAGSARNKDIDDNVAARPMSSLPTVRCPESMEEHSQVYQTPKLFSI